MKAIKKSDFIGKTYAKIRLFSKAYFPVLHAKLAYRLAYGKRCNLEKPSTFSEKLLWLSLNTYRNNLLVMELCDKYLVRKYVTSHASAKYLNDVIRVYNNIDEIKYDELPDQFALKISQGCATNIFCESKKVFSKHEFDKIMKEWSKGQFLYNKVMANVGGIPVCKLKKYYICEKYLKETGKKSPTDYKFYCFGGEPKAILVISDRFEEKKGIFMSTNWEILGELSDAYKKPSTLYTRPESLDEMINVARLLSKDFPFVRVDLYDLAGEVIFGEMTFFPNGCIHPQETIIDGKTMGELLELPTQI